jgi:phosphoglycolate phosphatase-like HAD superfamily hydrolase
MVGDTTHDLQMALNAGCASVGVSYGAHEPEAFACAGAAAWWRIRWLTCTPGWIGA